MVDCARAEAVRAATTISTRVHIALALVRCERAIALAVAPFAATPWSPSCTTSSTDPETNTEQTPSLALSLASAADCHSFLSVVWSTEQCLERRAEQSATAKEEKMIDTDECELRSSTQPRTIDQLVAPRLPRQWCPPTTEGDPTVHAVRGKGENDRPRRDLRAGPPANELATPDPPVIGDREL